MKKSLLASCALISMMAFSASAAVTYWDPQGTTGANPYTGSMTGTWDNSSWSTASGGVASPTAWVENTAACFGVHSGIGTPAYTITMNADHTVAGFFDGPLSPNSSTVTINGPGRWLIPSSLQAFDTLNASDGSLAIVTFNNVLADQSSATPAIPTYEGGGTITFNGANTFTGGISLGYSGASWYGTVNFASAAALLGGSTTALIQAANTTGGGLAPTFSTALTIPNPWTWNTAGSFGSETLNLVGTPAGLTYSGPWSLTSTKVTLGAGPAGDMTILSGGISGSGGIIFGEGKTGILQLAAANTYTGPSIIASNGYVQMANPEALNYTRTTVSNYGVLDLNGQTGIDAALVLNGTGPIGGAGGALINSSGTAASLNAGTGALLGAALTSVGTSATAPCTVTVTPVSGGSGGAVAANLGVTAASFTLTPNTQKYTVAPTIVISGGGGSGAQATCALSGTSPAVLSSTVTIVSMGSNYTSAPTVSFSGGTKSGSGTAPTITFNNGKFQINAVTVTAPGSGYTVAPTLSFSSGTSVAAVATVQSVNVSSASSVGGPGDITINSIISGAANLTKVGAGKVTLNSANTLTGNVIASAGTLALGANGSINTSPNLVITGGGTFDVTALDPYTLSSGNTLNASGTGATPAVLNDSAPSGSINLGSQPIVLTYTPSSSSGDLTDPALTVANGAVTFNANEITVVNAGSAMGPGTYTLINVAGGTITGAPTLSAAVTGAGLQAGCVAELQISGGQINLVVAASVNSPVWNGNDFANSQFWSDATNWVGLAAPVEGDAVTFDGSVTAPVMDSNNVVASLTFAATAGSFTLTNTNSAVLAVTDGITNNSPNLQTINMPLDLNNQTVQVAVTNGSITIGGAISDDGLGMAVSGPNTLTLTGVNAYTGPTTIGTGTTVTLGGAGQLHSGAYPGAITNGGTLNYNSTAPQILAGVISGGGALNANGGALSLSAVNTYTGPTTISTGSLTISAGSLGAGTYAANIADAASLVYNSTASQTLSGIISGIGSLTQGAGTLTLSGANTYSGNTVINAGTLKLGGAGDLGDQGGGVGSYAGNITDNGTLSLGSTATQTLSGAINGGGAVTITSGNVTLSGANSYSGTTSLTGGTLNVGSISDTGTANMPSNTFTFGGTCTFNYTGSAPVTTGRLITGNSGAIATFNLTGNVTSTNRITATSSGLFTINYNGPGTLTLSNTADNSYLAMNVNGGKVILATQGSGHALGSASSIGANGIIQLAGFGGADIYSGVAITNTQGGLLDLNGQNNGFSSLFLGSVGTNASLINSAAGTTSSITNSGSNVVLVANTVIGGAGNIALASGVYGGATSSTLTYSGTGSLILETTNYTTGAITVASGAVLLGKVGTTNGALVSATATVEAQSGAAFGSAASNGICGVAGAVTYDAGSTALFNALGGNTTTVGEVFITNNLTLNSTPVTVNVNGSALAAGTYVLMTNSGTLSGSVVTGPATITGTPLAAGSTATISMNGNSVVLTVTKATPVFSGLTSKTITYGNGGSATITLAGTISASGVYPASGEMVSATVGSGASVNGTTTNATGAFSITYSDPTITSDSVVGGPTYPITYNYAGNATLLNAASPDSSTTLTVNPLAAQFGGTELYSGTTSATNLTVTNAINGDTVTASGSATMAASGVPTEAVTNFAGVTLGGAQGGNYTTTGSSGSVTVTPAPLLITALAQSVPYGTPVPTTTVSYASFVGADTVASLTTPPTVSSALSGVQPVGSYPGNYTASGAVDPNYSITYAAGNFTVVNPFNPFAITSANLDSTGTNLVVCWASVPGVSYNILTNSDLTTTNWVDVGAPYSPTGPVATNSTCVTLPGATNANVYVLIKQN